MAKIMKPDASEACVLEYVAETIGFIAMLDGHPRITRSPSAQTSRAAFQQTRGTVANPLAHAIPSDMLLDGESLATCYKSQEACNAVQRVFGMGVMAPEDWEEQAAFPNAPRQDNVVDTITERHNYGGGLVEAFKACGEVAVSKGTWNGSGKRRHNFSSLSDFVADVYGSTCVPQARSAHTSARAYFAGQLNRANKSNPARVKLIEQRRNILDWQIEILEKETSISSEAAKNVWKFVEQETWK